MAVLIGGLIFAIVRRAFDEASSPPTTAAEPTTRDTLAADYIGRQLTRASTYVGGAPLKSLSLSTTADTVFSTCVDETTLQNYTITDGAVFDNGTSGIDSCASGFTPDDLGRFAVYDAVEDATGGVTQPVSVLIFSSNPTTTVITVTLDSALPISYDANGIRLESPIKD
ncbi:hypothetical protein EK0264_06905 [Epidermidibacterium keratini]|uniref:Uncharacterized protein n=1 Tax=Epidermidibacterium keratini TaxID=1891644 RepID=A0A7L4YLM4_9ACTN|nr:hypothetical protein [Epidermidibacterium keratini]QHC00030.1 hypothetical protein EK0264_06905 [Epidermidibacterium keratini]